MAILISSIYEQTHGDKNILGADTIMFYSDNRNMQQVEWWPHVQRLAAERALVMKTEMVAAFRATWTGQQHQQLPPHMGPCICS